MYRRVNPGQPTTTQERPQRKEPELRDSLVSRAGGYRELSTNWNWTPRVSSPPRVDPANTPRTPPYSVDVALGRFGPEVKFEDSWPHLPDLTRPPGPVPCDWSAAGNPV